MDRGAHRLVSFRVDGSFFLAWLVEGLERVTDACPAEPLINDDDEMMDRPAGWVRNGMMMT